MLGNLYHAVGIGILRTWTLLSEAASIWHIVDWALNYVP